MKREYYGYAALAYAAWRLYNSTVTEVSASIGGIPVSAELTGPTMTDNIVTLSLIIVGIYLAVL